MEKLVALRAPTVIFIAAVIANVDSISMGVDSEGNFIGKEIFVALVAKQVFVVKTVFADVNALAVAVDNFPSFGAKVLHTLGRILTPNS